MCSVVALWHPAPRCPAFHYPGQCKGKVHKPEHLGIAGRRVLVSRKGRTRRWMTTEPSVARLFGNSSKLPVSGPRTALRTGVMYGNAPHPLIPTCHLGPCCCCTPSPNDSDGTPNTSPRNWLSVNHPATVRQLAIKPRERGGTVQKYLSVPETAVYLNTSERFVRRLIAERRIAFTTSGDMCASHCPTSMSGCSLAVSSRSSPRPGGTSGRWRDGEQEGTPPVRQCPQAGFGSIPGPVPRSGWSDAHGTGDIRFEA